MGVNDKKKLLLRLKSTDKILSNGVFKPKIDLSYKSVVISKIGPKMVSKMVFSTPKCKNMKCETRYAVYELANLDNMSRTWTESMVAVCTTLNAPPKKVKKFVLARANYSRFIKDFFIEGDFQKKIFPFFRGRTEGGTNVYH